MTILCDFLATTGCVFTRPFYCYLSQSPTPPVWQWFASKSTNYWLLLIAALKQKTNFNIFSDYFKTGLSGYCMTPRTPSYLLPSRRRCSEFKSDFPPPNLFSTHIEIYTDMKISLCLPCLTPCHSSPLTN